MSKLSQSGTQNSKIELNGDGVGTISPDQIEARAREIALTDGREEPGDQDRFVAREELLSPVDEGTAPEETDERLQEITSWDEPADITGTRAPRVRPEDDGNVAEQLVLEGVEEADHEERVASAKAHPPEEV